MRELEERSGVSYNTIWRIEDGRQGAHPGTVRKLAEDLGVISKSYPGDEVGMARKKERGNGSGSVYPRKNKQGKIIGYRGSYFAPEGSGATSRPRGRATRRRRSVRQ